MLVEPALRDRAAVRRRDGLGLRVQFPEPGAVQGGDRVVDRGCLASPVAREQPADFVSRLCPRGEPGLAAARAAERPQQGDGLVEGRRPARAVDPQLGERVDQDVRGERVAELDGEAEPAQQAAYRGLAAAELPGRERALTWQEPVRGADDRLGVVGLAVVDEDVAAGAVEAVLGQELVLAELVVLRDCVKDRVCSRRRPGGGRPRGARPGWATAAWCGSCGGSSSRARQGRGLCVPSGRRRAAARRDGTR
jgi:hypothetical protein